MNTTITALLAASVESGDKAAAEALFARVVLRAAPAGAARAGAPRRTRRASARRRSCTRPTSTCRAATAGVSRIAPRFMAYASRVMRGLIIDDARRRQAQKRGGLFELTSLGTDQRGEPGRRAGAVRRSAMRSTSSPKSMPASPDRRSEVLLRLLLRRDRRDARRVGAHRAARLGKGADLSAPNHPAPISCRSKP